MHVDQVHRSHEALFGADVLDVELWQEMALGSVDAVRSGAGDG